MFSSRYYSIIIIFYSTVAIITKFYLDDDIYVLDSFEDI